MDSNVVVDVGGDISDFGNILRKSRKEKKMTQMQLAEASGLSVMSIRRYESGERFPGLDELVKLGQTLGFVIAVDADTKIETSVSQKMFIDETFQEQLEELTKTNARFSSLAKVFQTLNKEGQQKALETVEMISKIPEYQNLSVKKKGETEEDGQS